MTALENITKLLQESTAAVEEAAALLKAGQVVGIPTETVYGLAANALNPAAVAKIYTAKGRPSDNPLIVHVADKGMFSSVACLTPKAEKLIAAFCPGPLTLVLNKKSVVPAVTCGGLTSIAVRWPSHPTAIAVIKASGLPLAAPSANLSGGPSPTTAAHVMADMAGRIPLVIDGGPCAVGVESTVLSLTDDKPLLLRPGYITAAEIEQVLVEKVEVANAVLHKMNDDETAPSPGMKYKHYAPKTEITVVTGSKEAYTDFVNANKKQGVFALCYEEDAGGLALPYVTYGSATNTKTQVNALFNALRELDEKGATNAYAHFNQVDQLSTAVHNRLLRAAAFKVIEL